MPQMGVVFVISLQLANDPNHAGNQISSSYEVNQRPVSKLYY